MVFRMIPGVDIVEFLRTAGALVGLLVVAAILFAESGLLIGFFLPGDSLLFTVGFLAHQGVFGDVSVHLIVLLFFVAAAAGDSTGYAFGNRVGRKLFNREKSLLFQPENLHKAEAFYEKYGSKTIVLARFIPIIRTFAPIIAGVGKMHYRTFLAFNLVGAALWAAGITYVGYYAGAWFESMGINIDHYLLPIVAIIVLLSITPPALHILKDPKNRKAIFKRVKHLLKFQFKEATKLDK